MDGFQNKINEVKEKADIVDIIGQYVKLEKKGSDFIGLCPFHDDTNPSLSVSPSKKIFKCFSCNVGGNAISFLEKYKKIPFMEAYREVARTVNIEVAITPKERLIQKNLKYYKILETSTEFYQFYLNNTKEGEIALKYLHNRGLNTNIINRFKIGLSGSDNDNLFKYLSEKDFSPLDMVEIGVVQSTTNYYDTFRKRIIFPITDLDGYHVGFSGRVYLPDSDEAKYVNSRENVVFKKGQILYNYHEAFNEIKANNHVFLFEGFMDVIAAFRAGIENAVASMGTNLTNQQIQALKRITNNITICFDGDIPGIEATKRAITLLINNKMNVKVAQIPNGLDPDDYLNKHGEDKLNEFLTKDSISAVEYLYLDAKENLISNDINSVEIFKDNVFKFLSQFNSNVLVETYLQKMANELDVSFNGLFADYNQSKQYMQPEIIEVPTLKKTKQNSYDASFRKFDKIQKQLIHIALKHPDRCVEIENRFNHNYVNHENRNIMLVIHQYYSLNKTINEKEIKSKLDPELIKVFEEIMNMDFPNEIDEIEVLFEGFSKFPYVKNIVKLCDKPNKTKQDLKRMGELKQNIITFKSKPKE